ncbi:centrosomal protein cep290 [Uranotaenia lowii]|uniref:centrosomal protein cep290 n=1 Tax=Uranotaenia lowii TaxID=190385 RepID=UPI0024797282|nr:centrosomal protein cep290 [Uranotaenia lowii]
MDWRYLLSVSPHNLPEDRKGQLADDLETVPTDQKLDSKSSKKLFRLAQVLLRFRNEQVNQLKVRIAQLQEQNQRDLALGENSSGNHFREQLREQKRNVERLESERHANRIKIKELSEEISALQKKLAETSHFGSEAEDSPDALSEIDRQQELYNNISMKNKHIKRLLRDIDDLEKRNSFQIDTINSLQVSLNDATMNLTDLTHQFEEAKAVMKEQEMLIEEANEKIKRLEIDVEQVQEEKARCEEDLEDFANQLDIRTARWKEVLSQKQNELEEIQNKYSELLEQFPGYDVEAERKEFKKMTGRLQEKDEMIEQLEQKITMLSQEILTSTELMNRISMEKETSSKESVKVSQCCEESRALLENANKRCEEIQEILSNVEEDNMIKSRQAIEAVDALRRYESGEDGLANALKKINRLHEKVNVRDKQIRELIAEINVANEIAMENAVLRKRLGVTEDEVIPTHSILSKQRKIEKVNERLALKLRASEEMRLQLKLEKNDLKRKIFQLSRSASSQQSKIEGEGSEPTHDKDESNQIDENVVAHEEQTTNLNEGLNVKFCEHCMKQYNTQDSAKYCKACIFRQNFNYCDSCVNKLKMNFTDNGMVKGKEDEKMEKLEKKYATVLEENENLRMGMHEILQKLRDYDAMSNHLTIDNSMLERLLQALNARNLSEWYHPSMSLPKELLETKDRHSTLKDFKNQQSTLSVASRDDSGNVCDDEENTVDIEHEDRHDFSEQVLLKSVEIEALTETVESLKKERDELMKLNDDLGITQKLYDELLQFTKSTDEEKDKLLVETLDRLRTIESSICVFQRKVEFLKAENDNMHNTLRAIKVEHIQILHELKTELSRKTTSLKRLESQSKCEGRNIYSPDSESIERLEKEIERMKLETTNFYKIFLKNIQDVDKENSIGLEYDFLSRFGLVDSNLTIDFISKDEFKRINSQLKNAEDELKKQLIRNGHLQDLLKISQEQISSQQMLISKYSDEEISLRHLVADLQSSSNEKYLLARTQKDLDEAREREEFLKLENNKLKQSLVEVAEELEKTKSKLVQQEQNFVEKQKDQVLKIKFLTQSVKMLHESYNSYTPTYAVVDFVKQFCQLAELRKKYSKEEFLNNQRKQEEEYDRIFAKLNESLNESQIQDKIKLIKAESQCEYLNRLLIGHQEQIEQLQEENSNLKMRDLENTRHWDTIEMVFGDRGKPVRTKDKYFDKSIQVAVEISHKCINTIPIIDDSLAEKPRQATPPLRQTSIQTIDAGQMTDELTPNAGTQPSTATQKSLESQLKQAMMLASTRSALLLETESRLTECHGRIKLLEKTLDDKEAQLKKEKAAASSGDRIDDTVFSSTIGSLQTLLLDKDTTLSKYQELLRNERTEHTKIYDESLEQIKLLKKNIDQLELKLYDKQKEVDNLTIKLNDISQQKAQQEALIAATETRQTSDYHQRENAGLVYTDNVIENMYEIDQKKEEEMEALKAQNKLLTSKHKELEDELRKQQAQLRELVVREKRCEKSLKEKEAQIVSLNEQLKREHEDLKELTESVATAQEIEQLREMLEEKDNHIQDLTETLNQFHDDQQKFMNDTSLHSAEQVSQLSADLNRSEASNRVLKTQIEALKRQILSIQQREKQSRDLVKTLKNQLIKRPVIAMKPDRTTTPREDQLARKVQMLETELHDTKEELRKQISINESRRAKNAAELDLWNKQKRWQQIAEKLKLQLRERELELEKLKVHFNTAKTTIVRMEREKSLRGTSAGSSGRRLDNKYAPTETPDSCTASESTGSDEASTEINTFAQNSKEIIEALKNRIESQQRRIIAMELERKGSNSVTHELEKMQEKICNLEAQNIRLEAKSLQLQLDNDMLRQRDESERLKGQIKHLEDYIIILKEELSKATAGLSETINYDNLCHRCAGSSKPVGGSNGSSSASNSELTSYNSKLEQTVIALRRVVEKLKAENKHLRESKHSISGNGKEGGKSSPVTVDSTRESYDRLKKEHDKLQQNYSETLNRVAALQVEVELLSSAQCPRCNPRELDDSQNLPTEGDDQEKLSSTSEELKEQLERKSQLLEKAKILLSRAAAKERYLKEQISLLRRKCSDLQNVPVIDEISE